MSDIAAFHPSYVRHLRRREQRQSNFFWAFSLVAIFAGGLIVLGAGPELRALLAPAVASISITLVYLAVLTRRQGQLPIFEAASYFVLATCVYTVIPLLQFVMSGMECTPYGDWRLYIWAPTPEEFGGFAWRHVLLLGSFVTAYLLVRGKRLWPVRNFNRPAPTTLYVIVVLVVLLSVYFLSLRLYLGPVQSLYKGGTGAEYKQLPHIVRQLSNVMQIGMLTLKQSLVVVLLSHWRQRKWRYVLIGWLLFEAVMTIRAFEARVGLVILLLTFVAGYHHLVRPIRVALAFALGALLLGGFLLFGALRDVGAYNLKIDSRAGWGSATEFQILYGNAYDIYMRKVVRTLPPVPKQIYFSDVSRLVPSQLLPFEKVDPADWYRDLLGYGNTGMGFMFGIVAQSVIGFDWAELAVRGVLLALFYAFAHRAWRRYSSSFWVTVAYIFILAWAYYAFRASSFEILYRLVYYLAPAVLLVKLLTMLLSRPAGKTLSSSSART